MSTYVVFSYNANSQFIGLAIAFGFQSREAAQWWIDHGLKRVDGFRYEIDEMVTYGLSQCKEIWA
jgi:hypothetical protein